MPRATKYDKSRQLDRRDTFKIHTTTLVTEIGPDYENAAFLKNYSAAYEQRRLDGYSRATACEDALCMACGYYP